MPSSKLFEFGGVCHSYARKQKSNEIGDPLQMGTEEAIFMKITGRLLKMIWHGQIKKGPTQTHDNGPRKCKWPYRNSASSGSMGLKF